MSPETSMEQLALATASIRTSTIAAMSEETPQHRHLRLSLMAADITSTRIVRNYPESPELADQASMQAAANSRHRGLDPKLDLKYLLDAEELEDSQCHLVIEASTGIQWYECARHHGDENNFSCLSCPFQTHLLNIPTNIADNLPTPVEHVPNPELSDQNPTVAAAAAIEHLRNAAIAIAAPRNQDVLFGITECTRFAIKTAGEPNSPGHYTDDEQRLVNAIRELDETMADLLPKPVAMLPDHVYHTDVPQ